MTTARKMAPLLLQNHLRSPLLLALVCITIIVAHCQDIMTSSRLQFRRERMSWCTSSVYEHKKCLDWSKAIEEVNAQYEGFEPFEINLDCEQAADKDQCMAWVDEEKADMVLLDPGEIAVAGRHHSLTPLMAERYGPTRSELGHYSVAVIKKQAPNIHALSDLYGSKACISSVSHMTSWILPMASLIDLPSFNIVDCNNLVKSASSFFSASCAPNALINKFNPTGDNPSRITMLCESQLNRVGAHQEPYNGLFSALKCLGPANSASSQFNFENFNRVAGNSTGDVAFLKHNTVFLAEKLNLPRHLRSELPAKNDLELLCPQGGRMPLERWQQCNFGFAPGHAVVASSRKSPEARMKIQRFLNTSIQFFGGEVTPPFSLTPNGPTTNDNTRRQQLSSSPLQTQQQQLPPIAFESRSFFSTLFGSSFSQPTDAIAATPKKPVNFKLNGDQQMQNYPSLDVLFSSDMSNLVPLDGYQQTLKGYLSSFPVQPATTSANSNLNLNKHSSGFNSDQSSSSSSSVSYLSQQRANSYSDHYSNFLSSTQSMSSSSPKSQLDYFEKIRKCSTPAVVLCVTSAKEFNKCQAMSKAFHAAGLKPELNCKLAESTLSCMQLIQNRDADLVSLDPADIYLAGSIFDLIPILSEQIDSVNSRDFVVAVAKKSDVNIDLFNLQGRKSCHSGYLKASGWIVPVSFLLTSERLRNTGAYKCNSGRAMAEHFDKSCAPGILRSVPQWTSSASSLDSSTWTIRNMCELCHGTGANFCASDASEPFFGDSGALRCLVEGGGDVAFAKHSAIYENTGGSNLETWSRNLIRSDFELLCRDGSRAPVENYATCNLGTIPHHALVTRGNTPIALIQDYVNLFIYGQQHYGSKYSEDYTFKMFTSQGAGGKNLIFQDATKQLATVPFVNQTYTTYLDKEFLRALELVHCQTIETSSFIDKFYMQ